MVKAWPLKQILWNNARQYSLRDTTTPMNSVPNRKENDVNRVNKNSKESICDAYGEYRWKFMCCLPIKVKLLRVVCGGALYC